MRKLFFAFLLVFFWVPKLAFADLSCCTTQGGNKYCDYTTGKLYCNDGSVSTQCSCKAVDTPVPTPTIVLASTPTPTPINCPAFSSYDSTNKECKCNSGYVVSDTSCVTYNQYCWSKLGGNSFYDTNKNSCACNTGYVVNDAGTSCISFDQVCINKLGGKSYYDSDTSSCYCYNGYAIKDNQCQLIPTQTPITPQPVSQILLTNTPTPSPTPKKFPTPTITPTPFTLLHALSPKNGVLADKDYITIKNHSSNPILTLLENVWSFITHIF